MNKAAWLMLEKKLINAQTLAQMIREALAEIESPISTGLSFNLPYVLEDCAILFAKLGNTKIPYQIVEKRRKLGFNLDLDRVISGVGKELVKTGNILEARRRAELLENTPKLDCLILLSEAQSEIMDFKGAEETLDRIELDTSDKRYSWNLFQMARARAKAGNFTKAFEAAALSSKFLIKGFIEIAYQQARHGDRAF